MRQIKFRVWDNQRDEWASPTEVQDSIGLEFGVDDYFINIAGEKMARWSFMQYTGLKDKNGVEIYEGDILKLGDTCSFVVWCLDRWRFNSYMERGTLDLYPYVDRTSGKDIAEVVGNIYETPELLETKTN